MTISLSIEIANVVEAMLPTDADMRRGYTDAVVQTRAGEKQVIRLQPISQEAGMQAILRWNSDRDDTSLIRSLMAGTRADADALLASLDPESLRKLFVKAIVMASGEIGRISVQQFRPQPPIDTSN